MYSVKLVWNSYCELVCQSLANLKSVIMESLRFRQIKECAISKIKARAKEQILGRFCVNVRNPILFVVSPFLADPLPPPYQLVIFFTCFYCELLRFTAIWGSYRSQNIVPFPLCEKELGEGRKMQKETSFSKKHSLGG